MGFALPRQAMARRLIPILVALAAAAVGCGEGVSNVVPPPAPPPAPPPPPPPPSPSLRIEVAGWGSARDGDGFEVTVAGQRWPISWNGGVQVDGLIPATQSVALEGVSYHCRADSTSKGVNLVAGRADTVRFAVGCFGDLIFHEMFDAANTRIHYLDTLGGDRVLAPHPGRQSVVGWHPDGERVVVYSNENAAPGSPWFEGFDIGVATRSGSPITWIGQSRYAEAWPRWSPDGNQIVYNRYYVNNENTVELRLVNSDGSNDHQVLTPAGYDIDPAWVLGGTALMFGCQRFVPTFGICRMPRDGGPVTSVTTGPPVAQHVQANPAGDWVTLMGFEPDQAIYLLNANGGVPRRLDPSRVTFGADWAPDGVRIALNTVEGTDPYRYGIRVYNRVSGTISADLAGFATGYGGLTWSPDGGWIAMSAQVGGNDQIYVFRADGAGRQQLTFGPRTAFFPLWRSRSTFVEPPSWVRLEPLASGAVSAPAASAAVGRGQCFGWQGARPAPIPCSDLRRPR